MELKVSLRVPSLLQMKTEPIAYQDFHRSILIWYEIAMKLILYVTTTITFFAIIKKKFFVEVVVKW